MAPAPSVPVKARPATCKRLRRRAANKSSLPNIYQPNPFWLIEQATLMCCSDLRSGLIGPLFVRSIKHECLVTSNETDGVHVNV
jgi:hypothetical protein